MDRFEEILKNLKHRVSRKDNPTLTITIHVDDLTAIGSGVLAIALSSCELAPLDFNFNARDKLEFGKQVVEKFFNGMVCIIPSHSGSLRGYVNVTYEDESDLRLDIGRVGY